MDFSKRRANSKCKVFPHDLAQIKKTIFVRCESCGSVRKHSKLSYIELGLHCNENSTDNIMDYRKEGDKRC